MEPGLRPWPHPRSGWDPPPRSAELLWIPLPCAPVGPTPENLSARPLTGHFLPATFSDGRACRTWVSLDLRSDSVVPPTSSPSSFKTAAKIPGAASSLPVLLPSLALKPISARLSPCTRQGREGPHPSPLAACQAFCAAAALASPAAPSRHFSPACPG